MTNTILFIVATAASFVMSATTVFSPVIEQPNFSAALPGATAVFETSLAAPISSSATSMTLTANAVRGGGSISGYNCFTIDEGSAQHEVVCGTVSSTAVTSMTRGISFATGTTTDSDNQFAHRRGANVKITDYPVIQILKAQANGEDTYANILSYTSHPTFTADAQIVDKKYVDDIAFSGAAVIDATTAARGVGELATQIETASSTASGSSGVLLIPASNATSTYNAATAPLRVVVTKNSGKIDDNFISTSTLLANLDLATTTIIGDLPSWHIGKQMQVFTNTGTSSFAVPSGITKVSVEVVGAGGAGASCNAAGSASAAGGGGGGGGYAFENVDVTGTTSIQVHVGAASSNWSTFGTNGYYLYATGGASSGGEGMAGAGGTGVGGDINIAGQGGGSGSAEVASNSAAIQSGFGGSSKLGGGAAAKGVADDEGSAGGNYGGGGSGASCGSGMSGSGGAGAPGIVIVTW
jgi:hypothetical protein